jgi:thiol-disulfide isomerase/thioredoxin
MMKQKVNTLFILSLVVCAVNGSGQTISGTIRNNKSAVIYLNQIIGGKAVPIDSTHFIATFRFEPHDSLATGFYQLTVPGAAAVDLVVNKESVDIETDYNAMVDSLTVSLPGETRLYYDLVKFEKPLNIKLSALAQADKLYAQEQDATAFKAALAAEILRLQSVKSTFESRILQEHPGTFLASVIRANATPVLIDHPELSTKYRDNTAFQLEHYFDNIDFTDTRLLYSYLLPAKYTGYLNLLEQPGEEELRRGVDHILSLAVQNARIFEFTSSYLLSYFENTHYDEIFLYLSGIYENTEGCQNDELSFDLEKERQVRRRLTPGQSAPDLLLKNIYDQPVSLYQFQSKVFLLMFWASWCPHCIKILPELVALYKKFHPYGMEILAVSIDTRQTEWVKAIQDYGMNWVNASELKGWQSESVEKYNIRSTPSFFLLDQKKVILARVSTLEQVERMVAQVLAADKK